MRRFWEKVDIKGEDDCCEWQAALNHYGYGRFRWKYSHRPSHRVAYALINDREDILEEAVDGELVLHTCDNPKCCNPNHLYLGTYRDNNRDTNERGRANNPFSLSDREVKEIREKYIPTIVTVPLLALEYGVSKTTIRRVLDYEYCPSHYR